MVLKNEPRRAVEVGGVVIAAVSVTDSDATESEPETPQHVEIDRSEQRRQRERLPITGRDNSAARVKNIRAKIGSRRRRRWENFLALQQMVSEDDVDTENLPAYEESRSAFSGLFESDTQRELWTAFTECSSKQQEVILRRSMRAAKKEDPNSPVARYNRMDKKIKRILHKKKIPKDALKNLEECVLSTFENSPDAEFVTKLPNSFSRMLVHGISQYTGLTSQSFDIDGVRYISVKNLVAGPFVRPAVTLYEFLKETGRFKGKVVVDAMHQRAQSLAADETPLDQHGDMECQQPSSLLDQQSETEWVML